MNHEAILVDVQHFHQHLSEHWAGCIRYDWMYVKAIKYTHTHAHAHARAHMHTHMHTHTHMHLHMLGRNTQGGDVAASAHTAAGHDVRDEVFEIARPRGWATEAEDPPGEAT